jgi:hypothetical protein
MLISESIQCPYCGQAFDLVVDTSLESQEFFTDCEICCRPITARVECEPGAVLSVEIVS